MTYYTTMRSPIGTLTLSSEDDSLTGLHMGPARGRSARSVVRTGRTRSRSSSPVTG